MIAIHANNRVVRDSTEMLLSASSSKIVESTMLNLSWCDDTYHPMQKLDRSPSVAVIADPALPIL